ncbi:hypothetical protein CkaCkLH20_01921 [Colletotrichum karsti]|uniref:NACHT domain-containing protein n=1 Tax=Colletotrichum karsti TaxID=1095194 RepID=A0A9P6IDK4_9PEZI|nr:uncharacterized protein CkaCkLH20_01921 [Colletotrichum karsti]KAF9880879.1 hypothetical protein CkaCkLH20_01921 [Colletotrichum karsti]
MGLRKRLRLAVGRSRDPPDERNVPTSSSTPRASPSPRPPSESRDEPQPPAAGPTSSPDAIPATEPKARLDAWNKAYDDLKSTDAKLVSEYERLLHQEAGAEDAPAQDTSSPQTEIDHAGHKRRRQQMENIAQTALDRTEKEARGTKRAEEVMGVVDLARELGAPVIQTFPQAALPWAGVCAALQLFKNPITESKAQRDGMVHVITRMKWYCELENQLSRKIDNGKESDSGLLNLLEDKIVTLYTALLTFLMRSVCSYFKNRILAGLRNALKLDQWEDSLKAIKKSEEDIYRDVEYQNLTEVNSNLKEILAFAKEKESEFFENVLSVMQAQLTLQLSQLDQQCLKDVLLQDPRIAKEEIEDVKGGLFEESCEWVFENDDFRKWHEEDESRALWIHGDPGKGKTMLLCGIINSIQHRLPQTDTLSYFFCQADQPNSNTFTAVLRGIVYDLARKRPDLIKHVREVYDVKGTKLFTDNGSWADLSKILTQMVSSLDQGTTYLLIDALDECQEDRDRLMKFIINKASEQPNLRWIVTSRNWSSIGSFFEKKETVRSLSLENNADLISLAVRGYISYQVNSLAHEKGYDDGFRAQVETQLLSKAEETYLWVALVCKALRDTEGDPFWAEEVLNEFPAGLDDLYSKMMNQVTQGKQADLCRQVLSCLALVHRPITFLEMVACIDLTPALRSKALSEERLASILKPIVNLCGSFLKIRNETVYFVHQSAKEYLNGPQAEAVFPKGASHAYYGIFHRSIMSLMTGLHRDMYRLETPGSLDSFGIHINDVKNPLNNALSALSYSCVYWVDHLEACVAGNDDQLNILVDGGGLETFLKTHFLYWLEALSLLRAMGEGITSSGRLLQIVRVSPSKLHANYYIHLR